MSVAISTRNVASYIETLKAPACSSDRKHTGDINAALGRSVRLWLSNEMEILGRVPLTILSSATTVRLAHQQGEITYYVYILYRKIMSTLEYK